MVKFQQEQNATVYAIRQSSCQVLILELEYDFN